MLVRFWRSEAVSSQPASKQAIFRIDFCTLFSTLVGGTRECHRHPAHPYSPKCGPRRACPTQLCQLPLPVLLLLCTIILAHGHRPTRSHRPTEPKATDYLPHPRTCASQNSKSRQLLLAKQLPWLGCSGSSTSFDEGGKREQKKAREAADEKSILEGSGRLFFRLTKTRREGSWRK